MGSKEGGGRKGRTAKTRAPPAIPPTRPEEPPAAVAFCSVDAKRTFRAEVLTGARIVRVAALAAALEEIMVMDEM